MCWSDSNVLHPTMISRSCLISGINSRLGLEHSWHTQYQRNNARLGMEQYTWYICEVFLATRIYMHTVLTDICVWLVSQKLWMRALYTWLYLPSNLKFVRLPPFPLSAPYSTALWHFKPVHHLPKKWYKLRASKQEPYALLISTTKSPIPTSLLAYSPRTKSSRPQHKHERRHLILWSESLSKCLVPPAYAAFAATKKDTLVLG